MPDIPQSSASVLSQALTQLSKVPASSELTNAGVQILVKHLTGNTITLSTTGSLLSKTVSLQNANIEGQVQQGKSYQVSYSSKQSPSLDFFTDSSQKVSSFISLTEQQLQSLFKLPAKQWTPVSINPKVSGTVTLPDIKATVLPTQTNTQKPEPTRTEAKSSTTSLITPPLRLSINPQQPAVEIQLPVKQLNQFVAGDKVTINLVPKATNWQINIIKNDIVQSNTVNLTSPKSIPPRESSQAHAPAAKAEMIPPKHVKTNSPLTTTPQAKTLVQALFTPEQTSPLLKAALVEQAVKPPIHLEVPLKAIIQQFSKVSSSDNQALIEKLQTSPVSKVTLQFATKGEANLLIHSAKPVASIPIDKATIQALEPLRLPHQNAVVDKLTQRPELNRAEPKNLNTAQSPSLQNTGKVAEPVTSVSQLVTTKMPATTQTVQAESGDNGSKSIVKDATPPVKNQEEQRSNLLETMRMAPQIQSVITPSLLNNKAEQLNLVQSLLRIVQARAEPPSVPLQSIEKAIADPDFFKNTSPELTTKQLVEQGLQQVKQALPQGKDQDANQIRQLLTAPTLNLSAQQLISTPSNQGIVGGIVAMLQLSLSARLMRNQSNRTEQISSILNSVLSAPTAKSKPTVTPKALNELSQLEQKHQLSKEIGRLLSGHQTNKLVNAEQTLQGQDTFFYNLPSIFGNNLKDIELLVKREDHHKENNGDSSENTKTWQLTMKLSIGELGELLTKAKLRPDNLELDFYTSNEAVKIQVMNYLPLLRSKLESLGIEVSKSQCQLGKIPDTLQQRPYHVFQTKA